MNQRAALPEMQTALLVGATGLVGQQLLRLLLKDPMLQRVTVLVRQPLDRQALQADASLAAHLGKLDEHVVRFDDLGPHAPHFKVDAVFCALGTTIKTAGSQAAFRRVDFDYPLAVARLAKAQGVPHFLLVSALGAQSSSRVFYSRVKGELEDALAALNFDALTLARPSVLEGDRQESRPGEWLARQLGWLTPGPYKPVHVRQVALGLWQSARQGHPGRHVLNNTALRAMQPAATTSKTS
jgi:uncharacterized protein YbjT (DUF2867 family)